MKFSELNRRIMVAAFGIPAIIFLILAGKWWTVVFATFISIGFVLEFNAMLKKNNSGIFLPLLIMISAIWPALILLKIQTQWMILLWLIAGITILLYMLFHKFEDPLKSTAYSFFISVYGILFPSFIVYLRETSAELFTYPYFDSGKLILSWLFLIWICDTAAYIGGKNFGKSKLAPTISPNKTVEGFLFGIAGTIILAVILEKYNMIFLSGMQTIGLALIVGIFGQIGDLVESRIKRLLKVKDSSNLLPGHGGVMDRFDSLVFTAPFVVIYLYLISL